MNASLFLLPGVDGWEYPLVLPAALLVPAVVLVLGWWRGRSTRRAPWTTAAVVARACAIGILLLAAAGPQRTRSTAVEARRLAAARANESALELDAFDRVELHGENRTPAEALDQLRATRSATVPADLVFEVAEDPGAVPSALSNDDGLRLSLAFRSTAETTARATNHPGRLSIVGTPDASAPVRLELVTRGDPLPAGPAELVGGGRRVPVEVPAGVTRVALPALELGPGRQLVRLERSGLPTVVATVDVAGPPSVLYVLPDADATPGPVVDRLRTQGVEVATRAEDRLDAQALARASVVVLPPGTGRVAAAGIAERVRQGAGLLVLGGEHAGGLRRLRDGPLEMVLPLATTDLPPPPPPEPTPPPPDPPVEPPPRDPDRAAPDLEAGEKEALRVALLLCLDRSGSMAGGKLRLAQLAAYAATRSLAPDDRVGVIAFHDESDWVAPFQDVSDRGGLVRRLGEIRAQGGTNFYPALEEGFRAITDQRAGIRHVILLTDGETRPAVFRELVETGASQGITLSTIAIGDGANTELLARLAQWGRGRLYLATDPMRLPEVVTVDTRRFVDEVRADRRAEFRADDLPSPPPVEPAVPPTPSPEVEPTPPEAAAPTPVPLRLARAAPFTAGFGPLDDWPDVMSPETVQALPGAHVVCVAAEELPAVVLGRSQLGRVAALTFDLDARAGRGFWTWPRAGALLSQLVRSLAPSPDGAVEPVTARVLPHDDAGSLIVLAGAGAGRLELTHVDSDDLLAGRLEVRGDWSILAVDGRVPPGELLGTLQGDDGSLRTVHAYATPVAGTPPLDVVALADGTGLPLVDGPPPRRTVAGPLETERLGTHLLPVAFALVLLEAVLRRLARTRSSNSR